MPIKGAIATHCKRGHLISEVGRSKNGACIQCNIESGELWRSDPTHQEEARVRTADSCGCGMKSSAYLLLCALLLACSMGGTSQSNGKPDISVAEARKVPLFPPKGVSVKDEGEHAVITWDPIPLDTIVGYKIYRKVGDSSFTYIGTAKRPPFVDQEPPLGSALYTVTAVNTYKTESKLATPAKK